MSRRLLIVLFACLFAISGIAAGCGGDDDDDANGDAGAEAGLSERVTADELDLQVTEASEDYNIAFILGAAEGTFFDALTEGGEQAASELGVTLDVQGPPEYDAALQADVIRNVLATNPDGMAVEPVDKDASIAPLQAADDAGIPITTMDTVIGDGSYGGDGPASFPIAYTGSDNFEAGRVACEELAQGIDEEGEVFVQANDPGDSSLVARTEGCEAALAEYPDIEIVATEYGEEDAAQSQSQAEAVLQRHPDLAGIFANAGLPSEGTAAALDRSGRADEIFFVGFDAFESVIEGLDDGLTDVVIAQRPQLMGELAVKMVVAQLEGEEDLPPFVDTGTVVLTQENIDELRDDVMY